MTFYSLRIAGLSKKFIETRAGDVVPGMWLSGSRPVFRSDPCDMKLYANQRDARDVVDDFAQSGIHLEIVEWGMTSRFKKSLLARLLAVTSAVGALKEANQRWASDFLNGIASHAEQRVVASNRHVLWSAAAQALVTEGFVDDMDKIVSVGLHYDHPGNPGQEAKFLVMKAKFVRGEDICFPPAPRDFTATHLSALDADDRVIFPIAFDFPTGIQTTTPFRVPLRSVEFR